MVLFWEVTWAWTREVSGTSRIIWRFLGDSGEAGELARIREMPAASRPGRIIRKTGKTPRLARDFRG